MGFLAQLRSQLVNLKVFQPFFPVGKTIRDTVMFPIDYAKGGRASDFPSIINFNITTRCNLKCEFCFNKDNDVSKGDELSLEQIKKFIRQSAKYRPGFFLSGGEPFSRKDIFEIVDQIKRYALPVGIVTNGVFLNEEKVDRLMRLGVDVMVLSFHGTEEIHDRIVGTKGSYQKTMNALLLLAAKMKSPGPMINYIITEDSLAVLPEFLDQVVKLDNVVVRLSHLNFLTQQEIDDQQTFWTQRFPDDPMEILTYNYECDPSRFSELPKILSRPEYKNVFTKPILSDNELLNWYSNDFTLGRKCVFIWRSTFLNANGDVYPCQFLYIKMGNINDASMDQIWNNDLYVNFRRTLKKGLMPGCSRCCKV